MPVLRRSGGPAQNVGAGLATAAAGEAQFRGQLAQTLLRKQAFEQRSAASAAALQDRRQVEREKEFQRIQRGMEEALGIAGELGVGTDIDSLRDLDRQIFDADPAQHAQMQRIAPLPDSDADSRFAPAYILRGRAVQSHREARARQAGHELAAQVATEQESAGYSDEEVLSIAALAQSGVSEQEIALEVEQLRSGAMERRVEEDHREYARAEAANLASQVSFDDHPEAREITGRLRTGTSKNTKLDLFKLRTMANGDTQALASIEADAFLLGQAHAMTRQQAIDQGVSTADAPDSGAPSRGQLTGQTRPATPERIESAGESTVRPDVHPRAYRALMKIFGLTGGDDPAKSRAAQQQEQDVAAARAAIANFDSPQHATSPWMQAIAEFDQRKPGGGGQ